MSNVIVTAPSLLQGVSQQPALLRFPSQCSLQENAFPSPLDGLQKRQPLKHIARAFDGGIGDALVHVIDRGDAERYAVIVSPSDSTLANQPGYSRVRVFDLNDGTEKTVNGPGATTADFSYLALAENPTGQAITNTPDLD